MFADASSPRGPDMAGDEFTVCYEVVQIQYRPRPKSEIGRDKTRPSNKDISMCVDGVL